MRVQFGLRALLCFAAAVAIAIFAIDRVWVTKTTSNGTQFVCIFAVDGKSGEMVSRPSLTLRSHRGSLAPGRGRSSIGLVHAYSYTDYRSVFRTWREYEPSGKVTVSAAGYQDIVFNVESIYQEDRQSPPLWLPIVARLAKDDSVLQSRVAPIHMLHNETFTNPQRLVSQLAVLEDEAKSRIVK
ncbi:hypothetical protein NHH03_27835 [Stieleria sp. TO1_6]|uniref:hypothetical protein n=1 Tax=Stieleria tagensis TaxID=2956795 RepID=UPI00209B1FBE|nr:hypothetical protein [Stieleria tagensis]MCO8125582.1 hypothetical protein [Stieleria tagensis]